jgi:dTDP-4-amino-4,6-dideoxygalactose transaminase
MFPVTHQGTPTDVPCPFACPHYTERGGKAVYDPDACPVANDLYGRCVALPLSQWYTDDECARLAAGIDRVLSTLCGRDRTGAEWLPESSED